MSAGREDRPTGARDAGEPDPALAAETEPASDPEPARTERPDREAVALALLDWFRGRERDVPWRGEQDPYRVWVAEVMGQQTRIETVRPYYARFLERFPDIGALARADLDEVLKAWEGLGYYGRARNLHRAAAEIVEARGGSLPRDPEALRELPGIGPYTAGAIASLAFGRPEPAVDGNARRVLSRLFDLEHPTRGALEAVARGLLDAPTDDPAALNQAIMDLGGAVCTPRSPTCPRCPVRSECLALARGTVHDRPPSRRSREIPHRDIAVGIVWKRGRLLIQRRPEEGLLGGLWEFPGGKVEPGESPRDAVAREVREELGIRVRVGAPTEPVDHAYSHFRITLHPFHARWIRGEPEPRNATAWRWARPEALGGHAFPAANRRIIEGLTAASSPSITEGQRDRKG